MQQPTPSLLAGIASVIVVLWLLSPPALAQEEEEGASPSATESKPKTPLEHGKALTIELCQPCHQIEGADQAGTTGPPLVAMQARFPERGKLREIIYDAQEAIKPDTMMPPFGRHGLVNDQEIDRMMDFLYTL